MAYSAGRRPAAPEFCRGGNADRSTTRDCVGGDPGARVDRPRSDHPAAHRHPARVGRVRDPIGELRAMGRDRRPHDPDRRARRHDAAPRRSADRPHPSRPHCPGDPAASPASGHRAVARRLVRAVVPRGDRRRPLSLRRRRARRSRPDGGRPCPASVRGVGCQPRRGFATDFGSPRGSGRDGSTTTTASRTRARRPASRCGSAACGGRFPPCATRGGYPGFAPGPRSGRGALPHLSEALGIYRAATGAAARGRRRGDR